MSTVNRFRLVCTLAIVLCACADEHRDIPATATMSGVANLVQMSGLEPGAPTPSHVVAPYDEDSWSIYAGGRLYAWLNCVGCHLNGGGGIGPAFIDDEWIYGSDPVNIFATIWEGRPNGMPAFGGRISHEEAWNLVAYVRALGRLTREDAWVTPADHMRGPAVANDPHTAAPSQPPDLDPTR